MFRSRQLVLWLGILGGSAASSCQPDTPTHTEVVSPPVAAVDTLPAPTPRRLPPDSVTWHQVEHPTVAAAPLIRRGGLRRQVAPRDTAAPPPAEARLYDLTLKASEFHKIDPTRLAEVRGQEGTVLRIPANTFVDAQGQPVTGPVFVELKECYTLAEMVLSNLLTETTDDQLLTTGGMVLVRATANGQPVQPAAGRALQLELPAPHRRAAMQLYYGHAGRRQPVRWEAAGPDTAPAFDEHIYTDAHPMPSYGTSPGALSQLIRYPRPALEAKTQGTVFVSLVVDEAGRVLSPNILRGIGSSCDAEALRVLRQSSGDWTPGQRAGQFVKVKMMVPIRFVLPTAAAAPADSAQAPPTYAAATDELPAAPPTDRYVFNTQRLGWLSAAMPHSPAAAITSLVAEVEPDTHTSVRLLLRDAPTIILGQPTEAGYDFPDIPATKKAVLIGIRYMSGTPYVAVRETLTGHQASEPLRFRKTTLSELEQLLQRLL